MSDLLMLDPSVVSSEDGLSWLEGDEAARAGVVVPATFMEWMRGVRDFDPLYFVAPDDLNTFNQRRPRLSAALSGVRAFSYAEVSLSPEAEVVQAALFDRDDPAAEIWADEWAFLQSQSFLASKIRHPLRAFRDAGCVIVELARKVGSQLLRGVIPVEHIPSVLTPELMAKAAVKWVIVGGAAVGGGTLGGVVGATIGGPAGGLVGGKVGGFAAAKLTTATVIAIDP